MVCRSSVLPEYCWRAYYSKYVYHNPLTGHTHSQHNSHHHWNVNLCTRQTEQLTHKLRTGNCDGINISNGPERWPERWSKINPGTIGSNTIIPCCSRYPECYYRFQYHHLLLLMVPRMYYRSQYHHLLLVTVPIMLL